MFPKVGKTTRKVSWFRRESRSYTPCLAHAREDRPSLRTWPFLSILKTDPRRRLGLCRFPRFVSKGWQNDARGHSSTSPLRRPRRAGPRRAVTGGRPDYGTRPAAMLRRTRPGRASACDRLPGFGTRTGFGAHDRARFRHAASSTDPPQTGRTLSFSSICFQKMARRRARSVGFLERVVVTPRA